MTAKKEITVNAIQYTGSNENDIVIFVAENPRGKFDIYKNVSGDGIVMTFTADKDNSGQHALKAEKTDWLIFNQHGVYNVLTNSEFTRQFKV